jgi:heme exporter protein A
MSRPAPKTLRKDVIHNRAARLDAARAVFADQMRRHLDADGLILAAVHDPLPIPTRTLDLGGLA